MSNKAERKRQPRTHSTTLKAPSHALLHPRPLGPQRNQQQSTRDPGSCNLRESETTKAHLRVQNVAGERWDVN